MIVFAYVLLILMMVVFVVDGVFRIVQDVNKIKKDNEFHRGLMSKLDEAELGNLMIKVLPEEKGGFE